MLLVDLQGADFLESVDAVLYRAVCAAPKGVTDTALNEIRKSEKRKSTSVAFVLADLEKEQERRAKVCHDMSLAYAGLFVTCVDCTVRHWMRRANKRSAGLPRPRVVKAAFVQRILKRALHRASDTLARLRCP